MLARFLRGLFGGKPKGVFVIARKKDDNDPNEPIRFYVRPGVIVIEDDQVRFRNFTGYRIRIEEANFLDKQSFDMEVGEHKKVDLANGVVPNFYKYRVRVYVDANAPEDALGDSRPGAIIDR